MADSHPSHTEHGLQDFTQTPTLWRATVTTPFTSPAHTFLRGNRLQEAQCWSCPRSDLQHYSGLSICFSSVPFPTQMNTVFNQLSDPMSWFTIPCTLFPSLLFFQISNQPSANWLVPYVRHDSRWLRPSWLASNVCQVQFVFGRPNVQTPNPRKCIMNKERTQGHFPISNNT